jgi:DNA invertase Pin-like site-specific DNA recombinase
MPFKLGYSRESRENRNALRNQVYRLKQDGCDRILADVESAFQNDDRKFWKLGVSWIRSGLVSELVVPRLDRFSRTLSTNLAMAAELNQLKVPFRTLDYGAVDISTPQGWATLVNAGMQAELFSRQLSANVKAGKAYSRKLGKPTGSRIAYGYRRREDGLRLEIDPVHGAIALRVIEIFLETEGLTAACKQIETETGKPWDPCTLRRWLLAPALRGHTRYLTKAETPQIIYDTHPPLITAAQYERVQAIIKRNHRLWGKNYSTPDQQPHQLSGLCYCAACRWSMAVTREKRNSQTYVYMRCTNALCKARGRTRADVIEAELQRALVAKAYQVIRFVSDAAPALIDPRLEGLSQELGSLRALNRKNPRQSLELAILEIENEIATIKQTAHKPSAFKNELLEQLIHPIFWDEATESERALIYAELVQEIWVKDKAVDKIKLLI